MDWHCNLSLKIKKQMNKKKEMKECKEKKNEKIVSYTLSKGVKFAETKTEEKPEEPKKKVVKLKRKKK